MAPRKSHHASVALFYLALFFAFALLADASSPQPVNHKRLLRKRAPQGFAQPGVNPALTPSSRTSLSASSTAKTDSASSASSTPTPLIVNPLSSSSVLPTSSSDSLSTSSSSSSSSSLSSSAPSTSTSATSTSASSSSSLTSSSSTTSTSTSLASDTPSTFTQTATLTRASATPSTQAQGAANSSSSTKKTTTMVIIIIAASLGGITILWTLFRKWKLGRSSRFDERLQPIDWQPPAAGEGRHSSGAHGAHGSEHGHASSDQDHNPSIPDHDFTPLPSNRLAPVGAYTDLTRGPSPQPEMQEAYGHHSPAMTRPAYDVHVPLHHQAGYGGHGHEVYNHTQFNSGPVGY